MKKSLTLSRNCLATLALGIIMPPVAAELCQGLAIPAYFYPSPLWTAAIASAPHTAIMVVNPDSGPGTDKDPNYIKTVKAAQLAGIKILGYVHTHDTPLAPEALRKMDTVKAEIDTYKSRYGVDGIFLDEASSSAVDIAYYKMVANYVRAKKGGFVMLNPGVIPDQAYIKLADTTIVFEETYAVYQDWTPPSWIYDYPAGKFTHLVHTTATDVQMIDAIDLSRSKNAGFLYITDGVMDNPWDSLPTYWQTELSTITAKCLL